jgi:anaerobic magnesium-protoporphyrin IX monomethyl ester cyclase
VRVKAVKILLVNPPTGFSYRALGIMRPPLGLAYIAAVLKPRYEVEIIDFSVDSRSWKSFPYHQYDVVGISVDTARCNKAFRIAEQAKSRGATVVMGGLHVTFLDEDALESGVVDYVVRNEGEVSFLSLVDFLARRIPFEDVRGVSYLDKGEFRRTPDAGFVRDLDSIPFPARELLPLDLYREKMNGRLMTTLVSSRGCPYRCYFCSSSRFFGTGWRARSAESLLEEIELLHKEYGYRALSFVDDNFTADPRRVMKISERIISEGWDVIWGAMTRVDTIVKNPEMVSTMAKAGLRWTFIGFESGSQEALDAYGKKAALTDSFKAMEILKTNNVNVTGAFILGALDETPEMVRETIRFARKLDPRRAQFSLLTPYPGSELYEKVKSRLLTEDWMFYNGMHPTIKLEKMSAGELRKLQALAYATFYGRPPKTIQNLSYILRTIPILAREIIFYFGGITAGFVTRPIIQTKKYFAHMYRMLS